MSSTAVKGSVLAVAAMLLAVCISFAGPALAGQADSDGGSGTVVIIADIPEEPESLEELAEGIAKVDALVDRYESMDRNVVVVNPMDRNGGGIPAGDARAPAQPAGDDPGREAEPEEEEREEEEADEAPEKPSPSDSADSTDSQDSSDSAQTVEVVSSADADISVDQEDVDAIVGYLEASGIGTEDGAEAIADALRQWRQASGMIFCELGSTSVSGSVGSDRRDGESGEDAAEDGETVEAEDDDGIETDYVTCEGADILVPEHCSSAPAEPAALTAVRMVADGDGSGF